MSWQLDGHSSASLLAAFLSGTVNGIVRPLAVLLTLPLALVTLGLFLLVVNAARLDLVAAFLPGIAIEGFWTAILVSVVSWFGEAMFKPGEHCPHKN